MKVQRAVAASVFGAMGKGVLAAAAVAAVAVAASWLSWMDISVVLRVVPYEAELVWVDGGVDHDATTQQRLTVLSGDRKPYDVVLVHQAPRPEFTAAPPAPITLTPTSTLGPDSDMFGWPAIMGSFVNLSVATVPPVGPGQSAWAALEVLQGAKVVLVSSPTTRDCVLALLALQLFVIVEDPHCDVNLQDVRLGVVQTTRMNLAVAVQRYRWLPFTRRMIAQEGHRAVSALSNATLPLAACWSPAGPQW